VVLSRVVLNMIVRSGGQLEVILEDHVTWDSGIDQVSPMKALNHVGLGIAGGQLRPQTREYDDCFVCVFVRPGEGKEVVTHADASAPSALTRVSRVHAATTGWINDEKSLALLDGVSQVSLTDSSIGDFTENLRPFSIPGSPVHREKSTTIVSVPEFPWGQQSSNCYSGFLGQGEQRLQLFTIA